MLSVVWGLASSDVGNAGAAGRPTCRAGTCLIRHYTDAASIAKLLSKSVYSDSCKGSSVAVWLQFVPGSAKPESILSSPGRATSSVRLPDPKLG